MSDLIDLGHATLLHGDCLRVMRHVLDRNSVDAIVCDPPYGLDFMGKDWDHGVPGAHFWVEALRVAKPGAHLLAFGGTRTFHRLACAIEDAGWAIRDTLMWMYGSGFPKSLDVSKAIDKAAGAEREVVGVHHRHGGGAVKSGSMSGELGLGTDAELPLTAPATDAAKQWAGWGTALKPAWEPIILARKPLKGTVAQNTLKWGTGGINIDGCRVETQDNLNGGAYSGGKRPTSAMSCTGEVGGTSSMLEAGGGRKRPEDFKQPEGRWPANLIHDGSVDIGEASRFFYCAKASRSERGKDNNHPTVKPIALMRYLVRLVTPVDGIVLDPFMGSGTTGIAVLHEGGEFVGIEKEQAYIEIARGRIAEVANALE